MKHTKAQMRKHKKKNIRIFPFYKMFSWDLLFYYPIIFLFLTKIKGFSASGVLFSDALYMFSNMIWQIPAANMVEKFGKKNCLIIGNILCTLSTLSMIFMKSYWQLLAIEFVYATGYSIKGLCETNILYDSLPKGEKRGKFFSRIDGKSLSYFYIFDAVSSIIAGVTFVINGYIPIILCFISCAIATIISLSFKHTKASNEKKEEISTIEHYKQLKDTFKLLLGSKRMKSLILVNCIAMGLIFGIVNLRSSMLADMNVPEQLYGFIFALLQFCAAVGSRNTEKIHKKLRNKTLMFLTLPLSVSCILIGFIGKSSSSLLSLVLIMSLYVIQFAIKGPYQASITRYLNNFTNKNVRPKITALKYLTGNLCTAIISGICALLLKITSTANTFLIVGCITTIGIVLLLDYMKDKVGLKAHEYSKEEIKFSK